VAKPAIEFQQDANIVRFAQTTGLGCGFNWSLQHMRQTSQQAFGIARSFEHFAQMSALSR
jgi:hypothetical protein